MTAVDFSQKSLIFITGASRGIGKTLSIELSRKLDRSSILVLLARSMKGLEETKAQIQETNKFVEVLVYTTDLSKPDNKNFSKIFEEVLSSVDSKEIRSGIIFHNAGHLGTIKRTTELTDLATWHEQFDLNVFSAILLNSLFIKYIRPIAPQMVVVNVTSSTAIIPTPNTAMYGSGKAAREIFFKILAVEEPNIIVLTYYPGVVNTEMLDNMIDEQSDEFQERFKNIKDSTVLTPIQTVTKLLESLENGAFKSGDRIDYYEITGGLLPIHLPKSKTTTNGP